MIIQNYDRIAGRTQRISCMELPEKFIEMEPLTPAILVRACAANTFVAFVFCMR